MITLWRCPRRRTASLLLQGASSSRPTAKTARSMPPELTPTAKRSALVMSTTSSSHCRGCRRNDSVHLVPTSGTLPAGLTLASTTGVISGTPTGTGTGTFTVKVTDAHLLTSTKLLSVTVSAPSWVNSIAATGGTPQSTLIGAAFASTLKATVKDSAGN